MNLVQVAKFFMAVRSLSRCNNLHLILSQQEINFKTLTCLLPKYSRINAKTRKYNIYIFDKIIFFKYRRQIKTTEAYKEVTYLN